MGNQKNKIIQTAVLNAPIFLRTAVFLSLLTTTLCSKNSNTMIMKLNKIIYFLVSVLFLMGINHTVLLAQEEKDGGTAVDREQIQYIGGQANTQKDDRLEPGFIYEDVVYLKNGSVIRGQIIEMIPEEQIKIEILGGSVLVYSMEQVARMSKEKAAVPQQTAPAKTATQNVVYMSRRELRRLRPKTNREKGFYNHFSFSTTASQGDEDNGGGMKYSFGYQPKQYWGYGGSIGFDGYGDGHIFTHLAVQARGYLRDKSATPYANVELGYGIANGTGFGVVEAKGGPYFSANLGYRFRSHKPTHFTLGFGYVYQQGSFEFQDNNVFDPNVGTTYTEERRFNRTTMSLGWLF